jgi:hypothetical protein
MQISEYLIALILFSVVITIGTMALVDTADKYGLTVTPNSTAEYDKVQEISALAYDTTDDLKGSAIEDETSETTIIKNAFGALKNLLTSFTQVKNLITAFASLINIPDEITIAVISIVLILITFALFSFIFKWNV